MKDLKYVTYCGLYCRLCSNMARIPKHASALRDTMRKGGWEYFGESEIEGFRQFWKVLKVLSDFDRTIPGCRGGCGPSDCEIRKCAAEKGVLTCAFCPESPCELLRKLIEKYPVIEENLARQRELGVDLWIEEQEKLAESGFCYDDMGGEG